jgi:hypothetical protein
MASDITHGPIFRGKIIDCISSLLLTVSHVKTLRYIQMYMPQSGNSIWEMEDSPQNLDSLADAAGCISSEWTPAADF